MADRIRTIELWLQEADMGHRRGFGHTVSLAHQNVSKGGEAAGKIGSKGSGSGLDPVELMIARELAGLSRLTQGIESGWDQRHRGHCFVDEEFRHHRYVETRHQNNRRADNQGGIENHIQSVDVIERETARNMVGEMEGRRIRT